MFLAKSLKRLRIATILLFLTLLVGLTGFSIIEGYNLVDAFYMTIITLSTVGFGEIGPLSNAGKIFTSVYILLNLSIFGYFISIVTSYFFEGELREIFKSYIVGKEVKKLNNHIIVCGYGRNGLKACEELNNNNTSFVIVEKGEDLAKHIREYTNYHLVLGDATMDETLTEAGIEKASTVITTLPKDSDNVFICLTAKELNPNIQVIARASEENSEQKLYRAGATKVVMPDKLGGLHMAQLITKPYVIEFLDVLNGIGNNSIELEECPHINFKKDFMHKTLRELDIRNKTGATVIAVRDKGQEFIFNPNPDTNIESDDVLIVLGDGPKIEAFKDRYLN